jgi:hypothetical protein
MGMNSLKQEADSVIPDLREIPLDNLADLDDFLLAPHGIPAGGSGRRCRATRLASTARPAIALDASV